MGRQASRSQEHVAVGRVGRSKSRNGSLSSAGSSSGSLPRDKSPLPRAGILDHQASFDQKADLTLILEEEDEDTAATNEAINAAAPANATTTATTTGITATAGTATTAQADKKSSDNGPCVVVADASSDEEGPQGFGVECLPDNDPYAPNAKQQQKKRGGSLRRAARRVWSAAAHHFGKSNRKNKDSGRDIATSCSRQQQPRASKPQSSLGRRGGIKEKTLACFGQPEVTSVDFTNWTADGGQGGQATAKGVAAAMDDHDDDLLDPSDLGSPVFFGGVTGLEGTRTQPHQAMSRHSSTTSGFGDVAAVLEVWATMVDKSETAAAAVATQDESGPDTTPSSVLAN